MASLSLCRFCFMAYVRISETNSWLCSHTGQALSLDHIAFEKAETLEKAVKGCRATGIHPLDRNIFSDFLPAKMTHKDKEVPLTNDDHQFLAFETFSYTDCSTQFNCCRRSPKKHGTKSAKAL